MTLQIEGPTDRAAPGMELVVRRDAHLERRPARITALVLLTRIVWTGRQPLDRFARRAYASAGIGAGIAAVAGIAEQLLGWPLQTRPGQLLGALLVLGFTMFVCGGIGGSSRPRGQTGGPR